MGDARNDLDHLVELDAQVVDAILGLFDDYGLAEGVEVSELSLAETGPGSLSVLDDREHLLETVHRHELLPHVELFVKGLSELFIGLEDPRILHGVELFRPETLWRLELVPSQDIFFDQLHQRESVGLRAGLTLVLLARKS